MHDLEQVCETEWFIVKFLSLPFLTHLCYADVCHPYDFVLSGCRLDLKSVLVSCGSLSTTAIECCIDKINRIATRGKSIVKSVEMQPFRRKTPPFTWICSRVLYLFVSILRICLGNHMISYIILNKYARANFSKSNKIARARWAIRENCAFQGARLIESKRFDWPSEFLWSLTNQNACFLTSLCTELTLFFTVYKKNCTALNQSEWRNFCRVCYRYQTSWYGWNFHRKMATKQSFRALALRQSDNFPCDLEFKLFKYSERRAPLRTSTAIDSFEDFDFVTREKSVLYRFYFILKNEGS